MATQNSDWFWRRDSGSELGLVGEWLWKDAWFSFDLSLLWSTCEFWVDGGHACVHLCAWWAQLAICRYLSKKTSSDKKLYRFVKSSMIWIPMNSFESLTQAMTKPIDWIYCKISFPNQEMFQNQNKWTIRALCPSLAQTKAQTPHFLLLAWEQCTGIISLYLQPTCFRRPRSSLCRSQACAFSMCPRLWWLGSSSPGERMELIYLRGFIFWCCLEARSRCESNSNKTSGGWVSSKRQVWLIWAYACLGVVINMLSCIWAPPYISSTQSHGWSIPLQRRL